MADLTNPKVIWAKGILFFVLGLLASVLLVVHSPSTAIVLLLFISVWAFCRCYYFAFYVIQHYVDSTYSFSGLWSFAAYLWRRRGQRGDDKEGLD